MPWVLAELGGPEALVGAVRRCRELGLRGIDAHSPYPVHGLDEALGLGRSRIPALCLAGGLAGAGGGYLMQWYLNGIDFPINVGGRPLHSAPAFIPITFELGILLGALAVFFGLMAILGLPRLHHPVFEAESFRSATLDAFWLSAEVDAAQAEAAAESLRALGARRVEVVR